MSWEISRGKADEVRRFAPLPRTVYLVLDAYDISEAKQKTPYVLRMELDRTYPSKHLDSLTLPWEHT